jgi:hypothetical protein
MRDPTDIVELAKCYSQGELTREEVENMMRGYPLPVVVHGVNVFAKVFGITCPRCHGWRREPGEPEKVCRTCGGKGKISSNDRKTTSTKNRDAG